MATQVRRRGESDDDGSEEEPDSSQMQPTGQDPFLATSSRTLAWFSNNPNVVIGLVALLAVGSAAIYGGVQYMRGQAVAASAGVSSALAAVETPVAGSKTLQTMTSSDRIQAPSETFESEQERWQAVYDKAGETLDGYESSEAAQPARVTRAAAALRLGETDEAIELYQAYLDAENGGDAAATVHYGLSVAHAEAGNYDKAISALDEMIEADEELEAFAKYHKGMYLEASDQTDEAKKLYDEILQNNPETAYKTDIERRLALM